MGFADARIIGTAALSAGNTHLKYKRIVVIVTAIYRRGCSQLPSTYQSTCAFFFPSGWKNAQRLRRIDSLRKKLIFPSISLLPLFPIIFISHFPLFSSAISLHQPFPIFFISHFQTSLFPSPLVTPLGWETKRGAQGFKVAFS